MISVSSLHRAPLTSVVPLPRAARTRARCVMLFEPGTTTSARTGARKGKISPVDTRRRYQAHRARATDVAAASGRLLRIDLAAQRLHQHAQGGDNLGPEIVGDRSARAR